MRGARAKPKPMPAEDVGDRGPQLMTLPEVAKYLNYHYRTACRLIHQGGLPAFRLGGGNWRCRRADIEEWMAEKRLGRPGILRGAYNPRT